MLILHIGDIVQTGAVGIISFIDADLLVGFFQDLFLVISIHDSKILRIIQSHDIFGKDAHAQGMDGRDMTACTGLPQHVVDPVLHFPGCFIGKSDRQDMIRFHIFLLDQISDPHGQNAGLARTCTGNDPDVIGLIGHGLFLILIEIGIPDHLNTCVILLNSSFYTGYHQ